jgi:hypothetical protein
MALTKITGKGIGAVDEITSDTAGTSNFVAGVNAGDAITSGGNYNVCVGDEAGTAITTGDSNTAVGYQAGNSNITSDRNTFIGEGAGYSATSERNSFVGHQSGYYVSTGAKNTILGRFDGNQDGLDIRTSSNNIVLSDGDGRALGYYSSSGAFWKFRGNANGYFATSITQENTGGSPYGVQIQYNNTAPDNQNGQFIRCEDSSSTRFIVYNDGDVVNHDNSYGSMSDIKLKEQITNASSQWDDIKALTVRKYKMKSDVATGDSDAHWRLGLIAQEVETAGMNGLIKDNPDIDPLTNQELSTTTKSVKYSILYMKAVKALQEAMERIETLETAKTDLEARITALENA